MQCLAIGCNPSHRHDGTAWSKTDVKRARRPRKMRCRALLLECRGDWSWFKELFGFPSWSAKSICWMCAANRSDYPFDDFGPRAPWRTRMFSAEEFFGRQRQARVTRSPLFDCPAFKLSMVVDDVLHCLNLGVSQDALGNLFYDAVNRSGLFREAVRKSGSKAYGI